MLGQGVRVGTKHDLAKSTRSHHTKRVTKVAGRRGAAPHPTTVARTLMPTRSADRPLVVIDAGHGGRDPGAIGSSGMMEKTITLDTANELRNTLEKTGRYRVRTTRTDDRTVSLAERLAFAGKHDADLLIAIHADASRDQRVRGASVYVSNRNVTTQFAANRGSSRQIADALAAPEPQPEPSSVWLQYRMIEQLDDDVRMTTDAGTSVTFLGSWLPDDSQRAARDGIPVEPAGRGTAQQTGLSACSRAGDPRCDRRLFRHDQGSSRTHLMASRQAFDTRFLLSLRAERSNLHPVVHRDGDCCVASLLRDRGETSASI